MNTLRWLVQKAIDGFEAMVHLTEVFGLYSELGYELDSVSILKTAGLTLLVGGLMLGGAFWLGYL